MNRNCWKIFRDFYVNPFAFLKRDSSSRSTKILRASSRKLQPESKFSAETESKSDVNKFYFVQAADTQLGMMYHWGTNGIWPNRGTDGHPYPDSKWDMEIELCKKSVDILNSLSPPPAFFIVCGDLVDAYGHQYPEIREKQEFAFKEVYSNLNPGIPMICVCGNHDIGNSPTKESIDKYITSFGDDYFSFYKNGCCFLVLNSQFYADASNCPNLYQFHERWLDEELQKANSLGVKHIFLFQHIPWFIKNPDEENDFFNVEKDLRLRKLEQFREAGVKKIFCGHYHRNAGGFYKELEVVVTSAIGCQLGSDDHGMRIVKINEESIEHEYLSLENFPVNVRI